MSDVAQAVRWYTGQFHCQVLYQDDSWALLQFANVQLALVIPDQHPPHIGFTSAEAHRFGTLKAHRDGTESVYVTDPSGNSVEILAEGSLPS